MVRLILLLVAVATATAVNPAKRFGVPLEVEDECNPNIGGATFVADSRDCQTFYVCDHGWPVLSRCPADSVWSQINRHEGQCEAPHEAVNSACGHVPPPPPPEVQVEPPIDPFRSCDFQCDNGRECIVQEALCNGIRDCSDGSDEASCAAPCDPRTCRLPDCRCYGTDIPGGLRPSETPQFVMLTWESAIRLEDYNHLFQQILNKVNRQRQRERRLNPDGCPMAGTFFVSHQFTDYVAVQDLHRDGNEIASFSISHNSDLEYWRDGSTARWAAEMAGERTILGNLGFVKDSDVRGAKAPLLQMGCDRQFQALHDNNFLYDMSWPDPRIDVPAWPYTLDYRSPQQCVIPPCPTASFRGFWEVPLVNYLDTNDTLCAEVDNCYYPTSKREALELLRSNFQRHYRSNRAPFPLALRARWFYEGQHTMEAFQEFVDELLGLGDVFFVTVNQVIDWIKNPTPLNQMGNFFNCDFSDRPPICREPQTCVYQNITYEPNSIEHQGDRYVETCANQCPPRYPWVNNPEGRP